MESSTITPAAAEQTVTPVRFTSTASNYRIVRDRSRRKQLGESGEYEIIPGRSYQFVDGVFTADTLDDIVWLRNQASCGKYYFELESAPVEDTAGLQKEIMEKALAGDVERIADILVAERTALSRPGVISACEAAINAVGGQLPAKPDVPLHELQRVRMGPTAGETPGVSPDPVPGTPTVDPSTLAVPDAPVAAPADAVPASPPVPPVEPTVQEAPPVPPAPAVDVPPVAPAPEAPAVPSVADPSEPAGGAPGTPAS